MKSKISFFNKTIFLKNVTLYWPIWVVYTLFLVGGMPFALWLSVHDRFNMEQITEERMIREIYYVTRPTYYIFVIAVAAVIVGMALFSYLYKSQSANMIHALPVDRTELFGTNVISGLTFLIVPQIFTFIVTVLICLGEGITRVEYLAMWLLFAMATAFIAFAFVTICAFLTGQLVTMPVYVIIVNVLAYAIDGAISLVVSLFGYGLSGSGLMSSDLLIWFSPLINYCTKVYTSLLGYDELAGRIGIEFIGIECIIVYFIVAVVLYVLAYFIYRTRKIEQAGDLITVEILKPVFRWGVGTICGFYATLFFVSIFGNSGYGFNKIVFVIELLFFGTLFYFVADMFVRKTFHVFKKKNWKGCGLFCIALILTFGGMICYANIEEKRVPKIEDVDYAIINMNYFITLEDEDIAEAINIHKMVLEDVEFFEEYDRNNYYYYDERVYYTSIKYKLKDGSYLERYYSIPNTGKGAEIIDRISTLEQLPENMLSHWFGAGYEKVTTFEYGYLLIAGYYDKYDDFGMRLSEDMSTELTASQCKELFQAIIKDAKEGSLNKYNGFYLYGKEEAIEEDTVVENQTYSISLEYRLPAESVSKGSYDYSSYQYIEVSFGKDCKNIIAAIVDLGLPYINSEDDIQWYENGENLPVPEIALQNFVGPYYSQIEGFLDSLLTIGYYEESLTGTGKNAVFDVNYEVSPTAAKALYDAMMKDWLDGKLLKYNWQSINKYEYQGERFDGEENVFCIYFNYQSPDSLANKDFTLMFGSDCTNIINKLVELGVVDSKEDICWIGNNWDAVLQ